MTSTYVERLRIIYEAQFKSPSVPEPPAGRDALFNWVWMRTLLGEPVEAARESWERQRAEDISYERPAAELLKWATLAAAGELLVGDGAREARLALSVAAQASEVLVQETDHARVLQVAASAASLVGDDAALAQWRARRLELPVYDGWESTAFEVLYATGEQSRADELDALADAAARASLNALDTRPFDSISQLALTLAAHARQRGCVAADVLRDRARRLDEEVFDTDGRPRVKLGSWFGRLVVKGDSASFRVTVPVEGRGQLLPGAHELPPITSRLAERVRNAARRRLGASLYAADSVVEGVLRLDEGVEVGEDELRAFERRMQVAVEHARHMEEGLQCGALLRAERRAL